MLIHTKSLVYIFKSEVEETFKRLLAHKGVIGAIIVSSDGIAVRTSMDNSTTNHYCGLIQQLVAKSRSAVRDLDPSNDLTFLRIRSTRNEIMVAPGSIFFLYN
uniref:Dynein light chain roadblock n=1 Tax=Schistosoma haematobium TaxID=6185 RepID=A0A095A3L2_SCHHA